jgi:hypothetical protein
MTGADGDITLIVDGSSFSDTDQTFTVSRLSYQIHDTHGELIAETTIDVDFEVINGRLVGELAISDIYARVGDSELRVSDQLSLLEEEFGAQLALFDSVREAWTSFLTSPIEFVDMARSGDTRRVFVLPSTMTGADGDITLIVDGSSFSDTDQTFTVSRLSYQIHDTQGQLISEIVRNVRVSFQDGQVNDNLDLSEIFPLRELYGREAPVVDVQVSFWKGLAALQGTLIEAEGGTSTTTGSDGHAVLPGPTGQSTALQVSRAVPLAEVARSDGSINLQDAVSILKMIAGQSANTDGSPISRFQSLAADFDGSGTVSLADALGVLRHAVGRSVPTPSWVFVEEGDGALPSTLSPGIPGPVTVPLTTPGAIEVSLIGVLRGDVDGSYGVYGG